MARLKSWISCVLLIAAGLFMSAESATKKEVMDYFQSLRGQKTISGQHNKEQINNDPSRSTNYVEGVTGKTPGLWGADFLFDKNGVDSRPSMIAEGIRQWKAGALVCLTFNVCPPTVKDGTCTFRDTPNSVESTLTDSQWYRLLNDGFDLNREWKNRLEIYSEHLQKLKNEGIVPIIRPFQELNGDWFWWGGKTRRTVDLWIITHNYLSKKFDNLIWAWAIHNGPWLEDNWRDYYPGDQYVDLVTLDVYNDTTRTQPDNHQYLALLDLAGSKPIGLGEVGQLPTPETLRNQNWWVYFMGWGDEYIMNSTWNSHESIRAIYNYENVLNQGQLKRFS